MKWYHSYLEELTFFGGHSEKGKEENLTKAEQRFDSF